jgi:hypothetical protein
MWRGIMVLEKEMKVNDAYRNLVDEFMTDMDRVPDSLENFLAGLEHAYEMIESRLEVTRDEVRTRTKKKGE